MNMNQMNCGYPLMPQTRNGITWVQGLEGAKAYPLIPNSNAVLMDSEADKFYIKTCDNVGMCNLRSFSYKEEVAAANDYVTKSELEEIIRGIKNDTISTDESTESE